tara:strand:+ start:410 stop:847 length:438 start_codon:yes stop_codon:yes gene_type:complete
MSKNKKKIFKATTQHKLAQCWAEGIDADLKNHNNSTQLQLRNGTVTAITQSYDWQSNRWIADAPVTIAFIDDEGERVVYNYTGQNLADTYLRAQQPNRWNNGLPRYPDLVYAQVGKGQPMQGISTSLIYKLVEDGKATRILLPPA